jgi:hypothetical protein
MLHCYCYIQGERGKPSGHMKNFNISGGLYARNPIFSAIIEDPRPVVLRGIQALVSLLLITIHSLYFIYYNFYLNFFALIYLFNNNEKIAWQNDK